MRAAAIIQRRVMRGLQIAGLLMTLSAAASQLQAEDAPQAPKPQKEHEWLRQFVGEWESEAEASLGPDQPPMTCKGTQQARMLGDFWMIAEGEAEMMGMSVKSVLTLGYDPAKEKYIGTWIDSYNNHMWQYVGSVADNVLTLETEGPNFHVPGETAKYREVIEFKSPEHYVFSSMAQVEDGQWHTFMTANFRRKK